MKNHVIFFSGGKSSFTVAHLVKERYPRDNIVLYFTDTKWEDDDLYRFINEASDKLQLPMLTQSMGINPIQLMYKQKVLFNSRIGQCSTILKMKTAADYLKKNKRPAIHEWRNEQYLKAPFEPSQEGFAENTTLYFGIGWDEAHREGPIRKNWQPFNIDMPLIEEVIDNEEVLKLYDIRRPSLYDKGFVHNNCKGRCVKAGQGHFKNLYEKDPELFAEYKAQEHHLKNYVSAYHYIRKLEVYGFDDEVKEVYLKDLDECYRDYFNGVETKPKIFVPPDLHDKKYSFMKKSRNGQTGPYQLRDLEQDILEDAKQLDLFDIGGCSCFVDYSNMEEAEKAACEIGL